MKNLQYSLLAVVFLLVTGCNRDDENISDVKPMNEEAVATAESSSDRASKNEFLADTRKELDKLQQELVTLKEKIIIASEAEKEKLNSELKNFQQQQKELESKWNSFREEGSDTWKAVKKSFKESIEDLRKAIDKVVAREN